MGDDFCAIALYLYGDSIDVDGISDALSLVPTKSRRRGDVRKTSSGSIVVHKVGLWEYRKRVCLKDVSQELANLINELSCSTLLGMAGVDRAELDLFVPVGSDQIAPSICIEISPTHLRKIADLGLHFQLSSG